MEFDSINDAEKKVMIMKSIYDGIRVIDPEKKKIIYTMHPLPAEKNVLCYQFWETDEVCINCIAMRALSEHQTVVKLVDKINRIYTVTAVPVLIGNKRLVMEFIQDVTNKLCIQNGKPCDESQMLMQSNAHYIDNLLTKDSLTGLYNRRFIDESLPVALVRARTTKRPLSVIYADIDFFKSVNDTYGHVVGDQVLQHVANLFRKNLRIGDNWAARYGGEEFLICLSDTDYKLAVKIAERLRKSIMQYKFQVDEKVIHVTCSFGVYTVCEQSHDLTALEVITLADRNLYRAKENGRNKVV